MSKISKLKGAHIKLMYLIAFLLLLWATFMPAFTTQDPRQSDFSTESISYGYHFTQVTLIFYLIGVILIFFRSPTASIVLTAIGNAILSIFIIYFLYEVATIEKGEIWYFYYGFYIIVFLWIVLIIINISMFKFKSELSTKHQPD